MWPFRRREPEPVTALHSHRDVLDAATLGARYCARCDHWEVSLHGTVWHCSWCGNINDDPRRGVGHVNVEEALRTLVHERPNNRPQGGDAQPRSDHAGHSPDGTDCNPTCGEPRGGDD